MNHEELGQIEILAVQLAAVEIDNHLLHHGLGVGQLHSAEVALHEVAGREHGAEVLRSESEDHFVGWNLAIRANYISWCH